MQRAIFNCTIPVVMEFKSTPEISCESGCRKMPWQRLELYAGKLARTVLRGLGAGNRAWLPSDVRSDARTIGFRLLVARKAMLCRYRRGRYGSLIVVD